MTDDTSTNGMMRACQGYCGGSVKLSEARSVGRYGEKFCERCYGKWLRSRYQRSDTERDTDD